MATQEVFDVRIAVDNDAFAEDRHGETARILRKIADRLDYECCLFDGTERDTNGNTVAHFAARSRAIADAPFPISCLERR